jgi:TonB family protein
MNSERMMDWTERVAHRLIHRAAKRAPAALSERLEEEWLADLADRRGYFSRLRFAVGCCWATNIIAHDHELGLVPAGASPVVAPSFGSAWSLPPAWRRTAAFLLVAGLHVTVFYAFVVGLNPELHITKVVPFTPVPVPDRPRQTLPPPPRPDLVVPRVDPVMPEYPPDHTDDGGQVFIPTPPDAPTDQTGFVEKAQPTPPHVVAHVVGGPGSGFPIPDDYYPSMSIHMGETGAATVKVCVDAKGRLTSVPSIEDSTGISRLDGAAVNLAKAGSGHYRPSTDDGRPVDSCYAFRVRFNLKN